MIPGDPVEKNGQQHVVDQHGIAIEEKNYRSGRHLAFPDQAGLVYKSSCPIVEQNSWDSLSMLAVHAKMQGIITANCNINIVFILPAVDFSASHEFDMLNYS